MTERERLIELLIIEWLEWMSKDGCQQADDVLDLINRQKAEIENLTKVAEKQQSLSMDRYFEIKRLKEEIERLNKENEN